MEVFQEKNILLRAGFKPITMMKFYHRSGRLGSWALSKVHVNELHFQNPGANPQESFYQHCRHFNGWESLSLSQLLR